MEIKPHPTKPELNGVATAIAVLESNQDVSKALELLYQYCEFAHEYPKEGMFWHDFLKSKESK